MDRLFYVNYTSINLFFKRERDKIIRIEWGKYL